MIKVKDERTKQDALDVGDLFLYNGHVHMLVDAFPEYEAVDMETSQVSVKESNLLKLKNRLNVSFRKINAEATLVIK